MHHPTRGGVRGGRDQFKWDDVKVDKHRENYLGHSIKAPVGRWQKGKDLFWYTRDKKSDSEDALKEEIRRVKEEEEQSMREALGLAPKRSSRPQGSRLDKHEYAELIKRGSTAEDLGAGHAEAAQVQGLGLYKGPRKEEESSSFNLDPPEMARAEQFDPPQATKPEREDSEDDRRSKKRREERKGEKERKRERHSEGKERRRDKHERRHESDDRSKRHRKDKQKRRHDSDSG
ncbi:multiple myeloma tumor-associated protein 2 homolog [Oryza brachyantha]|uniref:Multiple myeloma tumor-associated protein 2-like N-terminal domain-containing protein n=1 Tax=Oryza brachyantha TaxID=4533 RepID=J3MVA3_ORYBR|nr:multiple myeloma tumor-associated protein 2 homolog [Oryza brachyantha]